MEKDPRFISGVPQKVREPAEEQRSLDQETFQFKELFAELLVKYHGDKDFIMDSIEKETEISRKLVEDWLMGIVPRHVYQIGIMAAMQTLKLKNLPVSLKIPMPVSKPEIPGAVLPEKKIRKSRLHARIQANKEQLKIIQKRIIAGRKQKMTEEEYEALEKKLRGEGKVT
jgi:hypothetical protein